MRLVLLALAGCGSFSHHLTARPTPVGKVDLGVNLGVIAGQRGLDNYVVLPNPEIAVRAGIADGVDFGGKVNVLGGEMSTRVRILEGELDLALAPALGFIFSTFTSEETESILVSGKLPVLVGVHFGDILSLIGGASFLVHVSIGSEASDDTDVLIYPGGTLGLNIQIIELIALFPEVNVFVPYSIDLERWRKPIFQGGVAVRFTFGG